MRPPQNSLGDQELQMLQFITDHAPVSVREVAAQWGDARDLARTTILTMMERLRAKGFLTRKQSGGAWAYTPTTPKTDVLQNVVQDFVQKTLGGRIAPFVAYLTETKNLSNDELADLKQLVRELELEQGREEENKQQAQSASHSPKRSASVNPPAHLDRINTNERNTSEEET